ncbi:MAG: hypothetical protein MJK04_04475 [Psychrosphaera sp.]|nr:hypothetical protein [Psychrosphaera sp.]
MDKWSSHIRSAIVGVMSMCILNIGMVIWWAAKLDAITISAVTRAELAIRDERIKYSIDAIKANKQDLRRTDDKLDRILRLLT